MARRRCSACRRRCYLWPATLLQQVTAVATCGRRRCYMRPTVQRRCYSRPPSLLLPAATIATCGRQPKAVATAGRHRCYCWLPPLQQQAAATATCGRRRCYIRPTPLRHASSASHFFRQKWRELRPTAAVLRPTLAVLRTSATLLLTGVVLLRGSPSLQAAMVLPWSPAMLRGRGGGAADEGGGASGEGASALGAGARWRNSPQSSPSRGGWPRRGWDLRAPSLRRRRHHAHHRAAEAEESIFSGRFPAARAAIATEQFFPSVTTASTQQAVERYDLVGAAGAGKWSRTASRA